ncbi:acyl-CoA dehydrogenase family protein [Phenylobacterium sp.]|uniref:acyl-CoA dehydrogenase family protein n=1 Tax=Phenylobacterium sp. TaxID=1871053 RepID=UPI0025E600E8|nr:acyl-CoA dehydrogenase family protein [Phenylobacterium sp.]MCA6319925.1 acyl-CoA/acyl-ACP dehydrogenase [Phenylobacterium sp.]
MTDVLILPRILPLLHQSAQAADAVTARVRQAVEALVAPGGRVDRHRLDAEQHAAHGLAWCASYAETLRQVALWAERLEAAGALTEAEALPAQLLAFEYVAQLAGGLPMNQGETFRPADLGVETAELTPLLAELRPGASQAVKTRIVALLEGVSGRASLEASGLDWTLEAIRDQFTDFSRTRVAPFAQGWHLRDELIPLSLLEELAGLGVFGLTLPEAWGGAGLGKTAMCVVSEALSRGWIAAGSLGTRSEIAAELILAHGTDDQKARLLPGIASGAIIPTAVFTEPGTKDHRGLSMLLAQKPRGTDAEPFPAPGMSGGEIGVIGYRGMKEYDIAFDGFEVPESALLGGQTGKGFSQLMATFESARIQTAARAVGVGQAALDEAVAYAFQRRQFDRPIAEFPRVANKLAMMAAELLGARRLTWFAAEAKDQGRRCDLEAGMAKLTAARIAWAAADNAVQVHGGAGFATEQAASRLLADARILNIFEGAGEVQAQVIARRLLEGAN